MGKFIEFKELVRIATNLHNWGNTIKLAHGCWDILHVGHVRHLQAAAQWRCKLMVTVTPDQFVNKGPGRPLHAAALRAEVLAGLSCVDFVAINEWATAAEAIRLLKPDIYVKGPECKTHQTPGLLTEMAALAEVGGQMAFTDGDVWSSTKIIEEMRRGEYYLDALGAGAV